MLSNKLFNLNKSSCFQTVCNRHHYWHLNISMQIKTKQLLQHQFDIPLALDITEAWALVIFIISWKFLNILTLKLDVMNDKRFSNQCLAAGIFSIFRYFLWMMWDKFVSRSLSVDILVTPVVSNPIGAKCLSANNSPSTSLYFFTFDSSPLALATRAFSKPFRTHAYVLAQLSNRNGSTNWQCNILDNF